MDSIRVLTHAVSCRRRLSSLSLGGPENHLGPALRFCERKSTRAWVGDITLMKHKVLPHIGRDRLSFDGQ